MFKFKNLLMALLLICIAPIFVGCNLNLGDRDDNNGDNTNTNQEDNNGNSGGDNNGGNSGGDNNGGNNGNEQEQRNDGYTTISWFDWLNVDGDLRLSLESGESYTLQYSINPTEANDHRVVFTSNNEAVARVDAEGVVTPIAVGTAKITLTAAENVTHPATKSVTVRVVAQNETLRTPTGFSYNARTQAVSWAASSVTGFAPTYKVEVTKDGEQLAPQTVYQSSLEGITPGAYEIRVTAIGNTVMYSDSNKSEKYTFTVLDTPTNLRLLSENNGLTHKYQVAFQMSANTSSIDDYEIIFRRTSGSTDASMSLPNDQAELWEIARRNAEKEGQTIKFDVPDGISLIETAISVRAKDRLAENVYASGYTDSLVMQKLKTTSELKVAYTTVNQQRVRQLTWSPVTNASEYKIVITFYKTDGTREEIVQSVLANNTDFTKNIETELTSVDEYEYYEVTMYTIGSVLGLNVKYLDSNGSSAASRQLDAVSNLNLTRSSTTTYNLRWDPVIGATTYKIYLSTSNTNAMMTGDRLINTSGAAEANFDIDGINWAIGDNYLKIIAVPGAGGQYYDSDVSVVQNKIVKLAAPDDFVLNGSQFNWTGISGAGKYVITVSTMNINNQVESRVQADIAIQNNTNEYLWAAPEGTIVEGEDYRVSIYSASNSDFVVSSDETEELKVKKYSPLSGFKVERQEAGTNIVWNASSGTVKVEIYRLDQEEPLSVVEVTKGGSSSVVLQELNNLKSRYLDLTDVREFKFRAYVVDAYTGKRDMYWLPSEYTADLYTYQIPTPTGLKIQDGKLSWTRFSDDKIDNSASFLRYKLIFTNSSGNSTIVTQDKYNGVLGVGAVDINLKNNQINSNESYLVSLQMYSNSSNQKITDDLTGIEYYILDSHESGAITARLLAQPSNLSIEENVLYWTPSGSNKYRVSLYKTGTSVAYVDEIVEPVNSLEPSFTFDATSLPADGYRFEIIAIGDNNLITSNASDALAIYKLASPILNVVDGSIRWTESTYNLNSGSSSSIISKADGYILTVTNNTGQSIEMPFDSNSSCYSLLEFLPDEWCGVPASQEGDPNYGLSVTIQALCDSRSVVFNSAISSAVTNIYKLPKIQTTGVVIDDTLVSWNVTEGLGAATISYEVVSYDVNDVKKAEQVTLTNNINLNEISGGLYKIYVTQSINSILGGNKFIKSKQSDAINILRFSELIGQSMSRITVSQESCPVLNWVNGQSTYNDYFRYKITIYKLQNSAISGERYVYYANSNETSLDLFNTECTEYYADSTSVATTKTLSAEDFGGYAVFVQLVAKVIDNGGEPEEIRSIEINNKTYAIIDSKESKLIANKNQTGLLGFSIQQSQGVTIENGVLTLINKNQNNYGGVIRFVPVENVGNTYSKVGLDDSGVIEVQLTLSSFALNGLPLADDTLYAVETLANGNVTNIISSVFTDTGFIVKKLPQFNYNTVTPTYNDTVVNNKTDFDGWYIEDGQLCWNKVNGVTTYKVGFTSDNNTTNVFEYGNNEDSFEKNIVVDYGAYGVCFELIGGLVADTEIVISEISYQIAYLNSDPSVVSYVNKLFAPTFNINNYNPKKVNGVSSTRVIDNSNGYARINEVGEFDFGTRDSNGEWVNVVNGSDLSGATAYQLYIDDVARFVYSLDDDLSAKFIASEYFVNTVGDYLMQVRSLGTTCYTVLPTDMIYLNSELDDGFTVQYYGYMDDFRVKDGQFVWDGDKVSECYDMVYTMDVNGDGVVSDLLVNTFYFEGDAYQGLKGDKFTSIKVRYSGIQTGENGSAGIVNTVWSNEIGNIVKLPDISILTSKEQIFYVDYVGRLAWNNIYEDNVTHDTGLTNVTNIPLNTYNNLNLNITSLTKDDGVVFSVPVTENQLLNVGYYSMPMVSASYAGVLTYDITAYLVGQIEEVIPSMSQNVVYLNSSNFTFSAPRLNIASNFALDNVNTPTGSQGVRMLWDISNSHIASDTQNVFVDADTLTFMYQMDNGSGMYDIHQVNAKDEAYYKTYTHDSANITTHLDGQVPFWELGQYNSIWLYASNSEGKAFASPGLKLSEVVRFNYFLSGNGTRENPYVIGEELGKTPVLKQLEMWFWLPELYFELSSDIALPDLGEDGYGTNIPYSSNLFNNDTDSIYRMKRLTGGMNGNGYKISNLQYKNVGNIGMWNEIYSSGTQYNVQNDKFMNKDGVILNLDMEVDSIDLSSIVLEYNGLYVSENKGLIYGCDVSGEDKRDEENQPVSNFVGKLNMDAQSYMTNKSMEIYFGSIAGRNHMSMKWTGDDENDDNAPSYDVYEIGRIENCSNTLNLDILFNDEEEQYEQITSYVGGIVGSNAGGYVVNCVNGREDESGFVNVGTIRGFGAGGIVGKAVGSIIKTKVSAGSFVDQNYNSYIVGCINYGTIKSCNYLDSLEGSMAGGIVAKAELAYTSFVINYGTIMTEEDSLSMFMGGIIALQETGSFTMNAINAGIISHSLTQEQLENNGHIGLLVGSLSGWLLDSMYAQSTTMAYKASLGGGLSVVPERLYEFSGELRNTSLGATMNDVTRTVNVSSQTYTIKTEATDSFGKYAQFSKLAGELPQIVWETINI